jgi:aspartate/methionine/tyrosine aminotransferase
MQKTLDKKRITPGAANQLNTTVFRLGGHTLRETDVLPALAQAKASGCLIVPSQLGDPVAHGLYPYEPFLKYLAEEMSNPKNLCYSNSCGYPPLLELLATGNVESGKKGYCLPPERVIIEAGISGAARGLFTVLINKSNGDEVIIPKWSYTLYLAEAELSEAHIRSVELDKHGIIDKNRLSDGITKNTKAVFITTIGNPLGTAISEKDFCSVIDLVNTKEREFNHPIYLVADTIYEGYRNGAALDPIALSVNKRLGPTIELYSLSKLIAAPGLRLGWMRIHHNGSDFKEEVHAFSQACSIMLQPGLGAVSTAAQIALYRLYNELENPKKRAAFDNFRAERRAEVRRRVHGIYDGLKEIPGLVFPECYYEDGEPGYNALNSFYILAGLSESLLKRQNLSHARIMADHQIANQTPAVVVTVPGDHFVADEYRGKGQEFFRIVALFDDTRDAAITSIRSFVESLKPNQVRQ